MLLTKIRLKIKLVLYRGEGDGLQVEEDVLYELFYTKG